MAIITTKVFFENKTTSNFRVIDMDNHLFGRVPPSRKVVLNLNYSQDFNRRYNLFLEGANGHFGTSAFFSLSINSSLTDINLNTVTGLLKLTITNEGNPKSEETPPNKLIIETVGKNLKIAPPSLIPPASDALLNANFY
jgi:hypothetical protein